MVERASVDALSDEERIRLLEAAAAEERRGLLVRCSTGEEVRRLVAAPTDIAR